VDPVDLDPDIRIRDTARNKSSYLFCIHQDMTEIFMDAKSSAAMLKENSAKYML
jgi:hypothetical protein